MAVCNLIFWSVVVPTTIFGCEVWVLGDKDLESIGNFQKFAGRRLQRFNFNSQTHSCYYGLGWMDLCTYACINKLIFLHTIVRLEEDNMVNMLFKNRAKTFNEDIRAGLQNIHKSPLFGIFKVSYNFGLYDDVIRMYFGIVVYSSLQWKDKVWKVAWNMEDRYWKHNAVLYRNENLLFKTTVNPRYLTWWHLSDLIPNLMRVCVDMARMVCGTSKLKCDDPKFKMETLSNRACTLCDFGIEENTTHLVMQCPYHEATRIVCIMTLVNSMWRLQVDLMNFKVRRNS